MKAFRIVPNLAFRIGIMPRRGLGCPCGMIKPFLLAAILSCLLSNSVQAASVGRSSFSAAAKVEGFEGIANGTDLAIQTPYAFSSGVRLTGPTPSIAGTYGPYIVGDGFYGLYGGEDVPDGVAYLGQANPDLFYRAACIYICVSGVSSWRLRMYH